MLPHQLQMLGIQSYLVGSIAHLLHGMRQLAQDCIFVVHVDAR